MNKTALITGISGQDGAYLAQFLLQKGYKVVGVVRNTSSSLNHLKYLAIDGEVQIMECDLRDIVGIINIITVIKPTEIYNLAAQSSVSLSFQQPISTFEFNTLSVLNLLEAIRITSLPIRYYHASSSEMFGKVTNLPIHETTPMHPLSPYAISKAAAHWLTVNYRESYGLFSCCGILFNHESYLRNTNFFVKKVIQQALEIKNGKRELLEVGNIEIARDFGYAPEYIKAMWLMLQQDTPTDYLICSGQSVKLRTVVEYVFKVLDIATDKIVVRQDLLRPTEIEDIVGSNQKAKKELKWTYDMTFFQVLELLIAEEIKNLP